MIYRVPIICPVSKNSLEFVPKCEKTWTKQEIQPKTWIKPGTLKYVTFQYILKQSFQSFVLLQFLNAFGVCFGAKITYTITWRMVF